MMPHTYIHMQYVAIAVHNVMQFYIHRSVCTRYPPLINVARSMIAVHIELIMQDFHFFFGNVLILPASETSALRIYIRD